MVDEEEERPSLHAQPLSLKDALLVACDSSDGSLTIGVNVQLKAERVHSEGSGDCLELCWVHSLSASDAGAGEGGPDGVGWSEQLFLRRDGAEVLIQPAVSRHY